MNLVNIRKKNLRYNFKEFLRKLKNLNNTKRLKKRNILSP